MIVFCYTDNRQNVFRKAEMLGRPRTPLLPPPGRHLNLEP
jgi:hypothetical protein